jgi:hypothetical protein
MKDEFQTVGLADMLNYLSRFKFDSSVGEKGSGGAKREGTGRIKDGMKCPRCQSVWRKSDNEVIYRSGALNG